MLLNQVLAIRDLIELEAPTVKTYLKSMPLVFLFCMQDIQNQDENRGDPESSSNQPTPPLMSRHRGTFNRFTSSCR